MATNNYVHNALKTFRASATASKSCILIYICTVKNGMLNNTYLYILIPKGLSVRLPWKPLSLAETIYTGFVYSVFAYSAFAYL